MGDIKYSAHAFFEIQHFSETIILGLINDTISPHAII